MLGSEGDAWVKKRCLKTEVMLDPKSEILESKRSYQASGFNFLRDILSRSIVSVRVREVRRRLQRAALLGDETDEGREER